MPSPDTSLATLRPDLAASLEEFDLAADREGFIASRVLTVIDVEKQAGIFGKIPIEQLLQTRESSRAAGAGYSRGNFTFTKDTYACDEHGLEEPIDDREEAMYSSFLRSEQVAAQRALDGVLRNAEIRAAAAVFNATTWASYTTAVTNEWDDATNATPRVDVKAAMLAVLAQCGRWPNALVINQKVFENLKDVAEILDRIKYTGGTQDVKPGLITAQAIADALGIPEIIVAGCSKNAAKEGQTVSLSQIWSDEYAMVCRVAKTFDPREPGIGRTFHWAADGSSIGGTIETYRDEPKRSDIVRCRHDVDEKITYVEAGHLLSNITA